MSHHHSLARASSRAFVFRLVLVLTTAMISTVGLAADVAITMDDFHIEEGPLLGGDARNDRILAALKKHEVRAALFVTARYLDDARAPKRLQKWNDQGHLLGNHTFSHWNYHDVSSEAFADDVLACEKRLELYSGFRKLFRFPMLKAGNTAEKRDWMRAFLKKHDYRHGYVTIDTSDWYIDQRLRAKLKATVGKLDLEPYRQYYLAHMWERAEYYDRLAKTVLGRDVKHTILVHHNLLNALFLDDVLSMFKARGWKLIDASAAFKDPVFEAEPLVLPAGESILWSLAKANPKTAKGLRYPGEDSRYEKAKMDGLGL